MPWHPARTVRAWARRHSYSFFSSLGGLLQHRLGTLMTVLVLGIAILLPLGLFVTLKNLDRVEFRQDEWNAITVFVDGERSAGEVDALADALRQRGGVASVSVVSPAQGLEEFEQESGFGASLRALDANPLPWVLLVVPAAFERGIDHGVASARVQSLMDWIEARPLVDAVQFDYKWLQRLARFIDLGRALVLVLSLLFGLAVLVLVANTIRLDVAARSEEIEVLALVGAGNGFIRQPFLYSGIWYGLMGGAVALGLMWLAVYYLSSPLANLLESYGRELQLYHLGAGEVFLLLAGSAFLGWAGALVSVQRYLRMLAVGGSLGRR